MMGATAMNRAGRFGAMVAAAALLAACGDGDSGEEAVIAALTAQITTSEDFDELDISDDDARCAAEQLVDEIGADRVVEVGFTGTEAGVESVAEADLEDLTDDELASLGAAFDGCVDDFGALLGDAVRDGIVEDQDPTFPIDAEQAGCVGDAIVAELGVERLVVIGARSEGGNPLGGLGQDEAGTVADVFLGCVDFQAIFQDQFEAEGVPADIASCLVDNIDDAAIREIFAVQFTGGDADQTATELLGPALEACGVQ